MAKKQDHDLKYISKADNKGLYQNIKGTKQKDTHGRLFSSLIDSKAYKDLSNGAKAIYSIILVQIHNKELRAEYGNQAFYFNKALGERFGFNNGSQRRKYLKELIEHGFIKKHATKPNTKSIYSLTTEWKRWEDGKVQNVVKIPKDI